MGRASPSVSRPTNIVTLLTVQNVVGHLEMHTPRPDYSVPADPGTVQDLAAVPHCTATWCDQI